MRQTSEPSAAAGRSLQVGNGLGAAARLQLLHHQIRLDPKQKGLARIGTASRRLSLQRLRFNQGLFAQLRMALLKATLCSGLKGCQRRSPHRRGCHAKNQ